MFPRLHYLSHVTLSMMVGITCQFLRVWLSVQLGIAALLIIFGIFYRWAKGYNKPLYTIVALSFLAGSILCYMQQKTQKNFLNLVAEDAITLHGYISSIEKIQNPRFSFRMIIETDQIQKQDTWHQCGETIALYIKDKPDLLVGDLVEINDVAFKQSSNSSFNTYLAKEKISATLFLENLKYTLIERPNFSFMRSLFYFKESLFATLRSKINRETFQLFSSIFLGNRTAVKKQMDSTKEPFKIWGTSHYLARSGLHLVIFVIVWHFILSLLPLSYLFKQLFLIMLILTYAVLSWSSVSFERALLMVLIYKWCLLARSPSHYVHLVVLVTALVLCINPLQLFFLDFQLSFGLTFALAWFNHIEARKKQGYS
jgi:predicted membrane metal-binding protein